MTVDAMRSYISEMYESDKWRMRVDGMPDRQVIAIYKNMKRRGQKPPKKKPNQPIIEQISMFAYLKGMHEE